MENLTCIYATATGEEVPTIGQEAIWQSYDSSELRHYFRCNLAGGTSKWFKIYYYPTRYGTPYWVINYDSGSTATWTMYGTTPLSLSAYWDYTRLFTVLFDWASSVANDDGLLTMASFGGNVANCSPFAAATYAKLWVPKNYEKKETRRYVEYAGTLSDGGFYARYRTAQYWTYELQMCGSVIKTMMALTHPAREIQGAEEAGTIDSVRCSQNGTAGWTITWTRSTFGAWGPIAGTNKTFGTLVYGRCPNNGLGE